MDMISEMNKADPFMEKVNKSSEFSKKGNNAVNKDTNEVVGKGNNRKLDEKWNIKFTIEADFFEWIFRFLREIGYSTIFRFNKDDIKIFVLDESTSHAAYVLIDRIGVAEYIVNGIVEENEIVVYVEMDMVEEMLLNNRYPVDIYFDTLEKKKMYIVNGKNIEMRRLTSLDNKDNTNSSYEMYLGKITGWIKNENTFKMIVGYNGFKGVIGSLEKKKGKKDETKIVDINFGKGDIEFVVGGAENETKTSSIMMYGEDIFVRGIRDVHKSFNLEYVVKLGRLKFDNNISFYVNESLPLVFESKFGLGKVLIYYFIAPKSRNN